MPIYYSQSGFDIEIVRPLLSNFSGVFVGTTSQIQFTVTQTNVSLTQPDEYTGQFSNATSTDPLEFIIRAYDTNEEIAKLVFPLNSTLVLISNIDGQSNQDISIIYPLRNFSVRSNGKTLTWVCSPLFIGCGGLEETVNDLPEPKIIGNLFDCTSGDYRGDITEEKSCSEGDTIQYLQIRDKLTNELIYSRIECCCPTIIPGPPPGFVCTCPDWGKATSYNQTLFSSSVRLREWILSGAGAKQDCKHIMAAKRIMGIDQPVYTDPPFNSLPPPSMPS